MLAAEAADAARTLTGLNLLLAAAPRPDANVEHLCAAMNGERPDPRASSDSDAGTTPARKVRAEAFPPLSCGWSHVITLSFRQHRLRHPITGVWHLKIFPHLNPLNPNQPTALKNLLSNSDFLQPLPS